MFLSYDEPLVEGNSESNTKVCHPSAWTIFWATDVAASTPPKEVSDLTTSDNTEAKEAGEFLVNEKQKGSNRVEDSQMISDQEILGERTSQHNDQEKFGP